MITWDVTSRGFLNGEFEDSYGQWCSIQASSHDDPHIWLGVEDSLESEDQPIPKPYLKDGSRYVHRNARMHLTPEQAGELWPLLKSFAEKSELPEVKP